MFGARLHDEAFQAVVIGEYGGLEELIHVLLDIPLELLVNGFVERWEGFGWHLLLKETEHSHGSLTVCGGVVILVPFLVEVARYVVLDARFVLQIVLFEGFGHFLERARKTVELHTAE